MKHPDFNDTLASLYEDSCHLFFLEIIILEYISRSFMHIY